MTSPRSDPASSPEVPEQKALSHDSLSPEIPLPLAERYRAVSAEQRQKAELLPQPPRLPSASINQILQVIGGSKQGVTEIVLHPEELGKIEIRFSGDSKNLSVTLIPEKPETLELFRRNAERLVSDLRQAGYQEVSLNFGQPKNKEGRRSQRLLVLEELQSTTSSKAKSPATLGPVNLRR